MISYRHKFIYIHPPKTAGNSIQSSLAEFCDDEIVERPSVGNVLDEDGCQGLDVLNLNFNMDKSIQIHAKLQHYAEVLGNEWTQFTIFASIRNPWERVISATAFFTPHDLPSRVLEENELVFPEPISRYLEVRGEPSGKIEFIRFENLAADFDKICRKSNLKIVKPLPRKNRTKHLPYREYFNEKTKELCASKYSLDIKMFDYQF